jgi:hypothetical protein
MFHIIDNTANNIHAYFEEPALYRNKFNLCVRNYRYNIDTTIANTNIYTQILQLHALDKVTCRSLLYSLLARTDVKETLLLINNSSVDLILYLRCLHHVCCITA